MAEKLSTGLINGLKGSNATSAKIIANLVRGQPNEITSAYRDYRNDPGIANALGVIGSPFEVAGHYAGDKTLDATGSPGLATVAYLLGSGMLGNAPLKAGSKLVANGAKQLSPMAGRLLESHMQNMGAMPGVLPPERFRGVPLKDMQQNLMVDGSMQQFGTDQRLLDIAKQYTADNGRKYIEQPRYATVDEGRGARLASAYDVMKNDPSDPAVMKSYDALIQETMGQYEALRKGGYKFDFMPESGDIYGNPRNAINDLVTNKRMSVFPTEQGFGSITDSVQNNPLLLKTGEKWNGKDVLANDIFRAVHDAFGHAKHGVGFRAGGEENAWQSHARMFSPDALPAITSETRGQNSWVNFGPFGKQNQIANPKDTKYADQKAGIMPDWTWKDGLLLK